MLTVKRESIENREDYSKNPLVLNGGIFRHADIFYKKHLSGRKGNPNAHQFDERIVEAAEFIYNVFQPVLGEKAMPYFYDTFRVKGDNNYYVQNKKSRGLSNHSKGKAGDLNWGDQETEDYILNVVSHNIRIKGQLYESLISIGIGGIGTYFRSSFGTFLHLDTGPIRHWDKYSEKNKIKAATDHRDFFSKIEIDTQFEGSLDSLDITILDNPKPEGIPILEPIFTPSKDDESVTLSYPQAVAKDLVTSVEFLWEEEEEDPMLLNYKIGQTVLQVVSVIAVVVVFMAGMAFINQKAGYYE